MPIPFSTVSDMPKKTLASLGTFPLRGKSVKLDPSVITLADMALLSKMYETTDLSAFPEDFLVLNGDVATYGWQRVLQFAIYEKYNYFLPFLKQSLGSKFEELESDVLNDFVYVYCTMMTLMLNSSGSYYDPSEEKEFEISLLDVFKAREDYEKIVAIAKAAEGKRSTPSASSSAPMSSNV